MDLRENKSEQARRVCGRTPPELGAGEAKEHAESGQAHMGQSFVTWANAGVLGFHMISGPLLGIFLGYYADKRLESEPVCVGIGLALGLVAGALNMYRDMRRILREQANEDAREKLRRMGRIEENLHRLGNGESDNDSCGAENSGIDEDDCNDPSSGYGRG